MSDHPIGLRQSADPRTHHLCEGISTPRPAALGQITGATPDGAGAPLSLLPAHRLRDFASRHTASAPTPIAGADAFSSAVTEEPEYLARYFVVKHSWRGRYHWIQWTEEASSSSTLPPST